MRKFRILLEKPFHNIKTVKKNQKFIRYNIVCAVLRRYDKSGQRAGSPNRSPYRIACLWICVEHVFYTEPYRICMLNIFVTILKHIGHRYIQFAGTLHIDIRHRWPQITQTQIYMNVTPKFPATGTTHKRTHTRTLSRSQHICIVVTVSVCCWWFHCYYYCYWYVPVFDVVDVLKMMHILLFSIISFGFFLVLSPQYSCGDNRINRIVQSLCMCLCVMRWALLLHDSAPRDCVRLCYCCCFSSFFSLFLSSNFWL